ncbi:MULTISPECIES: hypothetical protein [Maribacter]|uniref:Uncharacterized protein n=1 Tax=Maribacter flavus TaxID=1658664 RepID=A0ABU7IFE9_9FLAO|nr:MULTISPECIES: hypothetical protein [Maribacter]MDC6404389.1 hypothetical protein [Maribacter sp. PR66]MEE1971531.1 hypothetical protein [Maribacter flavus]
MKILAWHRYGKIENTAQCFILKRFLAVTAFLMHIPGLSTPLFLPLEKQ